MLCVWKEYKNIVQKKEKKNKEKTKIWIVHALCKDKNMMKNIFFSFHCDHPELNEK